MVLHFRGSIFLVCRPNALHRNPALVIHHVQVVVCPCCAAVAPTVVLEDTTDVGGGFLAVGAAAPPDPFLHPHTVSPIQVACLNGRRRTILVAIANHAVCMVPIMVVIEGLAGQVAIRVVARDLADAADSRPVGIFERVRMRERVSLAQRSPIPSSPPPAQGPAVRKVGDGRSSGPHPRERPRGFSCGGSGGGQLSSSPPAPRARPDD